jgi:N-acetylglucosaminyldiphosphoundecaprenol N-acetyl-beta-D-mannosaminyltransferase
MQANRAQLNVGAILAVGAALDTQAGLRRRAPQWMQKIAMEWFFRLLMEPRRLWRRYLIGNTRFVLLVMRQWARGKLDRLWRSIRQRGEAKAGIFPAPGATHEED